MNNERLRKRPKQGIIRAIRKEVDKDGPDLFAARVETDLTARRLRKQLVPVADTEKGNTGFQKRRYPFF